MWRLEKCGSLTTQHFHRYMYVFVCTDVCIFHLVERRNKPLIFLLHLRFSLFRKETEWFRISASPRILNNLYIRI